MGNIALKNGKISGMLDFTFVLFCAFSFVLLAGALGVILSRNPVHSALFLALAFLASAGVWMLLEAEFLALLIVLVYVGAVMVLFLFVVMMLDINLDVLREGFWRYLPLAVVAALMVAGQIVYVFTEHESFFTGPLFPYPEAPEDNTRALGAVLYTDYAYPLELAAALLLVAIVAAVALTLRRRKGVKHIDPAEQSQTKPQGRVQLVDMEPATPDDIVMDSPADDAEPLSETSAKKT